MFWSAPYKLPIEGIGTFTDRGKDVLQYYGYVVDIPHYNTNSPSPVGLFARATL